MKKSLKPYFAGYILSIILTLLSFLEISFHVFPTAALITTIIILALIQFVTQLFFFMGSEAKKRWNIVMLVSTIGLFLIVVIGSIWIMYHLKNNMSPQQINTYLNDQSSF